METTISGGNDALFFFINNFSANQIRNLIALFPEELEHYVHIQVSHTIKLLQMSDTGIVMQITTAKHGRQQDSNAQNVTVTFETAVVQIPVLELKRAVNAFHSNIPAHLMKYQKWLMPDSIQVPSSPWTSTNCE